MVTVRSRMVWTCDVGRDVGGQSGKLRFDLVDRLDDIGAGLLENE